MAKEVNTLLVNVVAVVHDVNLVIVHVDNNT